MKKINLLIALVLISSGIFAQTVTKALVTSSTEAQMVDLNVPDQQVEKVNTSLHLADIGAVLPNSFMYNAASQTATFLAFTPIGGGFGNEFFRQNELIGINVQSNEVTSRIKIQGKILGSILLSRDNAVGVVVVQRESNPYMNNDETVAFLIIEEGTGRLKGKIDLDFLSLNTPSMPMYGQVLVNELKGTVKKDVGISLPVYNPDRNQVLFAAIDVAGVNRLYLLDINSRSLLSQRAIQENVIDLAYVPTTKSFKVIYGRSQEYGQDIYAADLDATLGKITNPVLVAVQRYKKQDIYVDEGNIDYDQENNRLFVTKQITSTEYSFTELDPVTNEVISSENHPVASRVQFQYPYTAEQSVPIRASTMIKLTPNPARETVDVETFYNDLAEHVRIYDVTGKLVKDVRIESGLEVNTLSISHLITGVYTVEIQTEAQVLTRKLVVQ